MKKLDRVPFIILLLEAAKRFEALPEDSRTSLAAARIAINVGIAPKSGIGIGDDIVEAVVFYGNAKKHEERAWDSYQRLCAQEAA